MDGFVIYLASQSPRRAELLRQLGVRFQVVKAHVDETPRSGEEPGTCARRLAEAKIEAALDSLGSGIVQPILAADTLVAIDGTILGKPADQSEGLAMLARLSGLSHQVLSAITLWHDGVMHTALSVSAVKFRAITAEEAVNYWQTSEPKDKAGGYAIQGRGALFIERLEGSYSGVMGLPLFETAALLRAAGIRIL
ncbi:MAG TPA: Maf family protein [Gammaproteobacteria bacterium]|nr:Maf family protein [Gammaproteobacteria bacterium]